MDEEALLSWGALALGIILFGVGQLHFTFFVREYKKHVCQYGRNYIGKERGTSWTNQDEAVMMLVRIIWTLGPLMVAGLPLFFLTDLPNRGIYIWLGCTLLVVGLFLTYFATSNRAGLAKTRER